MPRVKVHDTELHYVEQGEGTPLLLVHGFPLDHTMWREQIAALSDRFRVITPDLRGFGQSGVTPGLATMPRLADDLAVLLDELRVAQPVVFCGLSMGGYVAWQFALRHRERLSKLILCDTKAAADSPEAAANRNALAKRVQQDGPGFVAETMIPKLFAPETIAANAACVEQTRQVILRTNPQGIAAASRGMGQRQDVTSLLQQFDLPTLVVCGQHDAITPAEEMRGLSEKLPRATYVEIGGAGHMSPLEKPAEVNAAIRQFLNA
ncbi:MAG: alpha/beta fold hydrolase [Pirellulaceae bacterium]